MEKIVEIDFAKFDSLNDYNSLEEKANDISFDYSISLSIKHSFKDYKAIWAIVGEEKNIDNFISFLNI